ncbi:MAG: M20/M25/M40 family metallo-hydrolase, partial [Oscillospiraceae bacterium]|nr:M20/M25/M40 family metallo-hydrolase [Oscillospiraceae bacterium]
MKKRILALALTLAMLLSMCPVNVFAAKTETATTEQTQQSTQTQQTTQSLATREELLAAIDYDAAMADLKHLVLDIGTRPAGSIGEEMAADFVAAEFEKLGYEVTRQKVPISDNWYWPGNAGEVYLGDLTLSAYTPIRNSYYTAFGPAEGTAVYLADPANVASLGSDLSGKVVFFPGNWRSGKDPDTISCIKALDAANAEAIVCLMDHSVDSAEITQKWFPTLTLDSSTTISTPLLLCNAYECERVPAYLAENSGINASVDCRDSNIHSHNAVGVKKAAVETDWTLYVCGHMDSVWPGSGTNDNASGTVGVLAMARAFQNVETNYNIVFVTVGAEEILLVGSKYFAQSLTAEEIDHAIGVYNMDMIATSYPGCDYIYMMVPDVDFSLTDNVVENRVVLSTFRAAEQLGYDKVVAKKEWASDHTSFNAVGIPAVGFILSSSADELKDEPVYHTIKDDMTNFDLTRFERSLELVTTAVYNDATAEFVAYVGEGKNREYYTSIEEATSAASAKGTIAVPMISTVDDGFQEDTNYPDISEDANQFLVSLDYKQAIDDLTYLTQDVGIRVAASANEYTAQEYVAGI